MGRGGGGEGGGQEHCVAARHWQRGRGSIAEKCCLVEGFCCLLRIDDGRLVTEMVEMPRSHLSTRT